MVVVFGALASVKKIFWFGHNFEKIMWIRNKDKTAHFSVTPPSQFVAKRRANLASRAPAARGHSALSAREVLFGGEILTFARTFFQSRSD